MVHDARCHGHLEPAAARTLVAAAEPDDADTLGGCAVYALDSTIAARPQADTLADRGRVYSTCAETAVVGHQYSWLGRIVSRTPAWFAPRDVARSATAATPAATAAAQVTRFVATVVSGLSVVVADSGYAQVAFLAALVGLTHVCGLVRLASNRVLSGAPPPADRHPTTGKRRQRGRPPVHGAKFALKSPPPPAQHLPVTLGGTPARLSAWPGLHFKGRPRLVGLVVRVEFLQADGTAKHHRPLWLFWSGPDTLALDVIAQMYLAR